MAAMESRWEAVSQASDARTKQLQTALQAWEQFDELSGRVQTLATDYDHQVEAQVSVERGLELETVDRQLTDCRVSENENG